MSEIKGQLLGVILVLAIFSMVSVAMYKAFSDAKDRVVEEISAQLVSSS
ncbi:MAG: hypothetical protein SPL00_04630 [Bacilli bacterium]|nr:hypothetical protein [Bacilli bacterium]